LVAADRLAVLQVVAGVDAVDEDDAGVGIIVIGSHDLVPEGASPDRAVHRAAEDERPILVCVDRRHESVGDEDREIEIAQTGLVGLRGDEGLDVGMVATHRRHHGATPRSGRHDRAAHGIPHIHERQGAGGVGPYAFDERALRAERRKVIADAAAVLHGERRLTQMREDGVEIVLDRSHDKAVEEGHAA
jgi:hypothetical protein